LFTKYREKRRDEKGSGKSLIEVREGNKRNLRTKQGEQMKREDADND
jgi:hypothetical protein